MTSPLMCQLRYIATAKFPPIRTAQKAEGEPHVPFLDRVEEIAVLMQVPTTQEAQKTVEVHCKNS